ncbi:hypothetical protein E4U37_003893 [Claviceps purpurea]|nr:hypothetical protein E4U37_003893 [Claviceps purpurea]
MKRFIVTGDDILRDQRFQIVIEFDFDVLPALILSGNARTEYKALAKVLPRIAPPHPSKAKKLDRNCNVTADSTGVPKHNLHPKRDVCSYTLDITLVVTLKSAVMTFSMEVDGEDSAEVDYT